MSTEPEPMGQDNEAVYDEQIGPLMACIIAICKQHHLPMLATFEYGPGNFCTSRLPYAGESPELAAACNLVRRGFAAVMITPRNR